MSNAPDGVLTFLTQTTDAGKRLDVFLVEQVPACTRSHAALLIRSGDIRVEGLVKKPGYRVQPGETISAYFPPAKEIPLQPEAIDIRILYEDEYLVVVDKPAGLVVHPAPGHNSGTLVNALLYHCRGLNGIGGEKRPGIVHRLDKDTSGVLVAAKTDAAHAHLSRQFKSRKVIKIYNALVYGEMASKAGTIEHAIGRHPTRRKEMSIKSTRARAAETEWRIIKAYVGLSLLELRLKTGRTHQIRVHCAAINHPVVGDAVYGRRRGQRQATEKSDLGLILSTVKRQMLHARRLGFVHPQTQEPMEFEATLPDDMQSVLDALERLES